MNRETAKRRLRCFWPLLACLALPLTAWGQTVTPVIEEIEELETLSSSELEELIGPIALYPDDLLAIVLPASTYPLQIVQAARFLESLETNADLKPDEDWDDSVVALLNYPEVVELLNEDLDWTWRLGEAVVAQQSDVIAAIELFRDRAYAAGNLESDDHQVVSHEGGSIQITPVEDDVIYVPYYEPEEIVVYQPRRVYYYYPRAYPVYYYPYPSHHVFHRRHFWGVTTAFTIGWNLHHLNIYHHSFYGHPYYGYTYWHDWWYRRPSIHIYNSYYSRNYGGKYNRYRYGDRWYPNVRHTIRQSDQRVTRTRYYPGNTSTPRNGTSNNTSFAPSLRRDQVASSRRSARQEERSEISFRDRPRNSSVDRSSTVRPSLERDFARTTRTSPSANRQSSFSRSDASRSKTSRPSAQPRVSTTRPSTQPRQSTRREQPQINTTRRPSQNWSSAPRERSSTSRSQPSRSTYQPRAQSSRSSQASRSSSRASQPRQSSSRASQPRQSSSRASQPKQSSSRSSQAKSQSRSSNSRRERR